ncbi:MAG: histidinol dehydrogenase [Nitrospira bacterium HGW-Nitrospira-1]|nr:MAG: histidinol dehydrogenase [Nitrospira bacterium HGW-Nitrospira-1]
MKIIKKNSDFLKFLDILQVRGAAANSAIEHDVRAILRDVKENGDRAALKYTKKYDDKKAAKLTVTAAEIKKAADKAEPAIVKALEIAARRIRKFHEMQAESSWFFSEGDTALGQIIRPLKRVGVYVPGGKAAYPSTVLMNVIPAQVAGVKEIALCVPAPGGEMNPYVMAAIRMLGIKEVYKIGGAQAVGAMAFGTKSIKKVDKIAGPGNVYVATAKKMVFGIVDIDMIAGPSEILIIADSSADATFVAADMLSQAEHDELASSALITDSSQLAEKVSHEIDMQLAGLKRHKIARASLENYGAIVITKNIREAVRLSNQIAPEHLEIMTENPMDILPMIENAGAVFLGPWTPEALGDYAAGPNHTLPTGGTARFFSPLGVYDFYKRSSMLSFSKKGFLRLSKTVEIIADAEGLEAHGNTIRVRKKGLKRTV